MLLSLKWLSDFVPYVGTAQALGERLTMLGLELEDIRRPFDNIKDIVVGHVVECGRHPEADKLSVCKVNVNGDELLDIVCGAPNVAAGQKVAVALIGTTLPDGLQIKKAKLRGANSFGMICSERELALSEDHGGIMVLPEHFMPGQKLIDALNLDTEVLELGITPNRSDCLSVAGLARETALAFNLPFSLPKFNLPEQGSPASESLKIEVPDPSLCWLYQGRIIENISINPSPLHLRARLLASGIRSISAIVDVTNYIMFGFGQPLHAFDLDKVEGGRIIISAAKDGETIVTLDGQERKLVAGDLLIRDAVKPIGLAGVMGGLNSEITADTKRVFLESAVFKPASIRKTAKRLALQSEASARFERGVDQLANKDAMDRAASMMLDLAGGFARTGFCYNEAKPFKAAKVCFSSQKAENLLGITLGADFCHSTLEKLGCIAVEPISSTEKNYLCPSWRPDLTREADLIEEVGRVYGLDLIPPILPPVSRPLPDAKNLDKNEISLFAFNSMLKAWGKGLGLNEAINYSFVGHKDLDFVGLSTESRITIMNPLSAEQNVLRTALFPGLLQNLQHNLAQSNNSLRLFEIARIFSEDQSSQTTAKEEERLGLMLYGQRFDANWPQTQDDADYSDIKGLVEHLLAFMHLPKAKFSQTEGFDCFNQQVKVNLNFNGKDYNIGFIGCLRSDIADNFHARKAVWVAELNLDILLILFKSSKISFKTLPIYPNVRRDITVIAKNDITVDTVLEYILNLKLAFLENVFLVDIFTPENSTDRNLTFRLVFRHPERTLKDNEVDKEREKAAASLVKNLDVKI